MISLKWPPDPKYKALPPDPHGCRPAVPLTEADVRRIVREELRILLMQHDEVLMQDEEVLNIPEFLRTKR